MIKFTDIYNHLITEARWRDVSERYRKYYDDDSEDFYKNYNQGSNFNSYDELVNHFRQSDPTDNGKYLEFLLKKSLTGRGNTSSRFIINLVNNFHRLSEKGYIKNKDIYSKEYDSDGFGLDAFKVIYDATSNGENLERTKQEEKDKETKMRSERDVIYEDDRWRVIVPKTHGASCHYGQGTQWCTTMKKSPNYYKEYVDRGILFYLIDKTKSLEDNDVTYRIALNWQWRKGANDMVIPMKLQSSSWFDSTDQTINPTHVIPLLPPKVISSIESYYGDTIRGINSESVVDDNVINDLMDYMLGADLGDYVSTNIESLLKKGKINEMEGGIDNIDYNDFDKEGFTIEVTFGSGLSIFGEFFADMGENNSGFYTISAYKEGGMLGEVEQVFTYGEGSLYGVWWPYIKTVFGLDYGGASDVTSNVGGLTRFLTKNKKTVFSDETLDFFKSKLVTVLLGFVNGYSTFGYHNLDTFKKVGDTVYWSPNNSSSTFKFKYPPKEGSMTNRFIKAIKEEPGITNREFYSLLGREYTVGNNTQFFGSIKDSGIVRVEKGPYGVSKYYLGPTYEEWTKGNLKKYER